jgi:hypothetical protein
MYDCYLQYACLIKLEILQIGDRGPTSQPACTTHSVYSTCSVCITDCSTILFVLLLSLYCYSVCTVRCEEQCNAAHVTVILPYIWHSTNVQYRHTNTVYVVYIWHESPNESHTPAINEGCTRSLRISHSMYCIVPSSCDFIT